MKTIKLLFLTMLLLVSAQSFSQTSYYELMVKNVTRVDTDSTVFDLYVSKIAGDSIKLGYYDFTFAFDYAACANGGVVKVGYATGTSSSSLPTSQRTPVVSFDSTTQHFRFFCAKITTASSACKITTGSGIKLGTFYLKGSNPFVVGSHANFVWYSTQLVTYINRNSYYSDITLPWRQYVLVNTALN